MRRVNSVVVSAPKHNATGGSVVLPFTASSAGEARRQLDRWMTRTQCPVEVADDARLVVSELVGNAVRHAQPLADGTLKVVWRSGRKGLEIAVTDGGSATAPHKVNASTSAIAGRGLAIIETLASRWWTDDTRSSSTVHALLAV